MGITFRTKLLLIVGTAVVALGTALVGSAWMAEHQAADLTSIEGRLIPKLDLAARLESRFQHLTRNYETAVATHDSAALAASQRTRDELFELIRKGSPLLDPGAASSLRGAIQDYVVLANDVAARRIAGETDNALAEDVARARVRQDRARELIAQTLQLRPDEVSAAVSAVRVGGAGIHRFRLAIDLSSIALLLLLSVWTSRDVLAVVDELSQGFLRFATGDFAWRIPVRGTDELGRMAREANQMAEDLRRLSDEHARQREELSEKNIELEDARLHLQQKADELARVSSYKSRFLANVSHELRTPLNSMLLLSQLLSQNESGNLTPRQVEHAKTVHDAGEDLLSLINQLLDLSKIEAGRQELHLEAVPLEHFIEHARRVFEPLAAEKRLLLTFELAAGLPVTIYTDRQRVERILVNLLGNAIKFTVRGKVSLSIGRPSRPAKGEGAELDPTHSIAFSVSDTGVGIAAEAQSRVFAPFEQLESQTDRRYSGTGLGLAIARESALLLGGDLGLESTLGEGSTFTCCLPERPRARAQLPEHRARSKPSVADDRDRLHEGPGHLLIVDDDPVFAEQLLDVVHARGLQAVVASTGEEAIELARTLRPRGVLLDVRLPDIDGWTVMLRLRERAATRSLPIHIISAVDAPERALKLGAIGYLVKPTTHAKLVGAVRALTPRAAREPTRLLVVEDDSLQGEALVLALQRGGLEAHCVDSAAAALDAIERDSYACMILDLGLPDMDGLDLLERLTQRTSLDPPHVVVHTGRALTRAERTALDSYADAVVAKGDSSLKRLLEEVRRFVTDLPDYATREALLSCDKATRGISLEGAKLLLAEDDMRTVYAISALLQASGAKVLIADSGRDALDVLSKNPDVNGVLMDVLMPEMDGYEAIRRLRSDPRFIDLPVVALSARAMQGERERCLRAGASGYLAKPVDSEQLLYTVRAWLTRRNHHGN